MLIYLFVKLKRKRFNFAYDCCHLPLVYQKIHAGKLYSIKFYCAVELYLPVEIFLDSKKNLPSVYRPVKRYIAGLLAGKSGLPAGRIFYRVKFKWIILLR